LFFFPETIDFSFLRSLIDFEQLLSSFLKRWIFLFLSNILDFPSFCFHFMKRRISAPKNLSFALIHFVLLSWNDWFLLLKIFRSLWSTFFFFPETIDFCLPRSIVGFDQFLWNNGLMLPQRSIVVIHQFVFLSWNDWFILSRIYLWLWSPLFFFLETINLCILRSIIDFHPVCSFSLKRQISAFQDLLLTLINFYEIIYECFFTSIVGVHPICYRFLKRYISASYDISFALINVALLSLNDQFCFLLSIVVFDPLCFPFLKR
jgi:hypothetical protein